MCLKKYVVRRTRSNAGKDKIIGDVGIFLIGLS